MKKIIIGMAASLFILGACQQPQKEEHKEQSQKTETMEQISAKDFTTFTVSDSVEMYRVSFPNQYKMNVVGHLFIPKSFDKNQKHPAIIEGIRWEPLRNKVRTFMLPPLQSVDLSQWR
ncbi:hypothetical protein [Chryseobacterium sp. SIMBA_029]|uniref:hypothetical protein n=1 Tax=Chryseobacterium sp. SIMBA_029 TaxID=3085772 RepID=UPI00397BD580